VLPEARGHLDLGVVEGDDAVGSPVRISCPPPVEPIAARIESAIINRAVAALASMLRLHTRNARTTWTPRCFKAPRADATRETSTASFSSCSCDTATICRSLRSMPAGQPPPRSLTTNVAGFLSVFIHFPPRDAAQRPGNRCASN
jgi:hypothetical protein